MRACVREQGPKGVCRLLVQCHSPQRRCRPLERQAVPKGWCPYWFLNIFILTLGITVKVLIISPLGILDTLPMIDKARLGGQALLLACP